ncbi:DNA glycosylase [Syncephalis plumigaleata]|nr:DNA glycosylase [Syncephalis plumigaleata]
MQTRRRARLNTKDDSEVGLKRRREDTKSRVTRTDSVCTSSLTDIEDLVDTARVLRLREPRYRYRHSELLHEFSIEEQKVIQQELLQWYRRVARTLPWRIPPTTEISSMKDQEQQQLGQRAYEVWVSEIMLQQTQVKTVVEYYKRWMSCWPSVQTLANADIEEVNKIWAGLGYYSRARRLHEAARMLVQLYDGILPTDVSILEQKVPGIGRYTAGAIASIAYNQPVPIVDGNVQRVISRLRSIAGDMKQSITVELFWQLAGVLVANCKHPGDFNQALMELGATICTPVNPDCNACPLRTRCRAYAEVVAYKQVENDHTTMDQDIIKHHKYDNDTDCSVCATSPYVNTKVDVESIPHVAFYPCKGVKKAQREEVCTVYIIERNKHDVDEIESKSNTISEYLLVRRPNHGLLAGLWEFPTWELGHPDEQKKASIPDEALIDWLKRYITSYELDDQSMWTCTSLGSVTHLFTHIRKTYHVEWLQLHDNRMAAAVAGPTDQAYRWIPQSNLLDEAIPTALKKAYKLLEKHRLQKVNKSGKGIAKSRTTTSTSNTILSYFTKAI